MVERYPSNREKRVDRETENGRALCCLDKFGLRTDRQTIRALFWWLDRLGDLTDYRAQRVCCGRGLESRPLRTLVR